jgi:hypothetical protein
VPMPTPGLIAAAVDQFQPDIVHAHHPFLRGGTALRLPSLRTAAGLHASRCMTSLHYISGDPDSESPLLDNL